MATKKTNPFGNKQAPAFGAKAAPAKAPAAKGKQAAPKPAFGKRGK